MGLNPDIRVPADQYAYKDPSGNWRAGAAETNFPDVDMKYDRGQYVPEAYAKQVRNAARTRNLVKRVMSNRDMSEDMARDEVKEYKKEQAKIREQYDGPQKREQLRNLRLEKLGS